ncbi:MAG: cytidylate kinase [Rhodobiaceae bacterium]|nr:cytidylate kinase [Rhodobiaceae bacterium]MAV99761.1 cytidylate kinase [Rhodobiaceae bacterium]RPF95536.1 MAG: (d)CMP kinase [Rhizobiales bacterium TMED227]RPF98143.1 MAG: (d)CMP kinase [Rhizobiales bacterium TMED227]
MIIAIDGPAASGKGTIAKKLSEYFGLPYLDSGLLYRIVASEVIKHNINPLEKRLVIDHVKKINFDRIDNKNLRNDNVSRVASIIAQYKEVRDVLLRYQRSFAISGVVMDGRDIGTVIFPNANYKFYITATLDERTNRRFLELVEQNSELDRNIVKNDINNRDQRDIMRKIAPLTKADDAIEVDTTFMKIDDVIDFIVKYIHKDKKS